MRAVLEVEMAGGECVCGVMMPPSESCPGCVFMLVGIVTVCCLSYACVGERHTVAIYSFPYRVTFLDQCLKFMTVHTCMDLFTSQRIGSRNNDL